MPDRDFERVAFLIFIVFVFAILLIVLSSAHSVHGQVIVSPSSTPPAVIIMPAPSLISLQNQKQSLDLLLSQYAKRLDRCR